jgi:hypothetical protein
MNDADLPNYLSAKDGRWTVYNIAKVARHTKTHSSHTKILTTPR